MNERAAAYLGDVIDIVACRSFRLADTRDVARLRSSDVKALVLSDRKLLEGCDAVIVCCTNLLSLDVIDEIEDATGLAVVSSNLSLAWAGLRAVGVAPPSHAPGSLFRAARTSASEVSPALV